MNELHAHDRATQCDDGEFAQDLRRFDLAFFEAEPLALEGPEQLLDMPAATIIGDGLVRLRDGLDRALDRSRQWTGVTPAGASSSRTSRAWSATLSCRSRSVLRAGRARVTAP